MRGVHASPRSARSTARASSTRDDTPTFRKMLRRWRLDRLLAEEELGGDLRVRLAVDHEPRDLELAPGQRVDPGRVGCAGGVCGGGRGARACAARARPRPGSAARRAASKSPPPAGARSVASSLLRLRRGPRPRAGARARPRPAPRARPRQRPTRARARPPERRRRRPGRPPPPPVRPRRRPSAAARSLPMPRGRRRPTLHRPAVPSASRQRVSTSRYLALGLPAISVSSSPPAEPISSSTAGSGCPVSRSAAARSAAASDEWKLPPASRLRVDALLGGGERQLDVSLPAAPSTSGRRGSRPARCVLPSRRADSIPPSSSSPACGQLAALAPDAAEDLDQDEDVLALAGRARHGQRTGRVPVRLRVPVEVELHAGEPRGGPDVPGELVVGERVDDRRRLETIDSARSAASHDRVGDRETARAPAVETSSPRRRAASTARCAQSCIASNLVRQKAFPASSIIRATASAEPWSGSRSSARGQAGSGLLLPPEQELAAAAQALADLRVVGRELRPPPAAAAWLSAKRPTAVSAPGAGEEQLDPLLRRRASTGSRRSASANQCAALAGASRTASSPASRRTAAAATSPSRAERSTWWARAAADAPRSGERRGATLVGAEPPAGGGRLVDRPANERMPEAEAPRDVGRPEQIELRGARRSPPSPPSRAAAAAAAASSGSNGSPATAAPSSDEARVRRTGGRAPR